MKANKFVEKFGWDAVNHDFSGYFKDEKIGTIQILTHENEYIEVNGDDLKRLVESHELVESYGGVFKAKEYCGYLAGANEYFSSHGINELFYPIKQAIADVESCNENQN